PPTGTPGDSPTSTGLAPGAIAGITVALLAVAGIAVLTIWLFINRRRQAKGREKPIGDNITHLDISRNGGKTSDAAELGEAPVQQQPYLPQPPNYVYPGRPVHIAQQAVTGNVAVEVP